MGTYVYHAGPSLSMLNLRKGKRDKRREEEREREDGGCTEIVAMRLGMVSIYLLGDHLNSRSSTWMGALGSEVCR